MDIKSASFIKSSSAFSQLPPGDLPEYGFVGRSNVGKSSWINCLCDRKGLAKTSSTPGKTQLINHFVIDDSWLLADLPGYGYARVSKKKRAGFADLILDYATERKNLLCLFVLVDARIPPQALDLEFLEFLGEKGIPFVVLFTKTDKPNQKTLHQTLNAFNREMKKSWEELPMMIQTSAVNGRGRSRVLSLIEEWNAGFQQN